MALRNTLLSGSPDIPATTYKQVAVLLHRPLRAAERYDRSRSLSRHLILGLERLDILEDCLAIQPLGARLLEVGCRQRRQ